MKKLTLLLSIILSHNLVCQIKIKASGNVGIGVENPVYNCEINNILRINGLNSLNGSPTHLLFRTSAQTEAAPLSMKIGSSTNRIDFWYSTWNEIQCESVWEASDSCLKTRISNINFENALKLLKLESKQYYFKGAFSRENSGIEPKLHFGFLAQDIQKIYPNIVRETEGNLLVNYSNFLPLMLELIKHQQLIIDTLNIKMTGMQHDILNLSHAYSNCCNESVQNRNLETLHQLQFQDAHTPSNCLPKLFQNKPNPFDDITQIDYELCENDSREYELWITSLDGKLLKQIYINSSRKIGTYVIEANYFKPGIYLYLLISENEIVVQRKMIKR
ncbi:MAG: tail fiber domain-containing protein [Flavobacteriales bacterium]